MRYLVDVTQKQAEEITKLINSGKYQTVAQFISTAIENQIYIESSGELFSHAGSVKKNAEFLENAVPSANTNIRIALNMVKGQPKTVSLPPFSSLSASLYKTAEEKSWLWGQTNKIFPIKVGIRVLYVVLGSEEWLNLEEFRNKAADIAATFGTTIRKYEEKKGKIRDERISAGLPKEGEFKSKFRYKGHFLAYIRKDGKLEGAMPFLRFVNLKKDEKERIFIGLTDPGLKFAKLESPVIDQNNFETSLSSEEIEFYLVHINREVKGESAAIKWLLNKISNGINDRETINKELNQEMNSAWGNPSPEVINTQRAGLTARMFELGLIGKIKEGIKVKYTISPRGQKFISEK